MTKTISVWDLDGTLIIANSNKVKVKYPNSDEWLCFNSYEWSQIKHSIPKGCELDFSDFEGIPDSPEPIIRNMKIMDTHIEQGHDVGILTARINSNLLWVKLSNYLRMRSKETGKLTHIPYKIFSPKNVYSADTNEVKETLKENYSIENAKAYIIENKILKDYDKVFFYDDDPANIEAVNKLNNKNVIAIKVER